MYLHQFFGKSQAECHVFSAGVELLLEPVGTIDNPLKLVVLERRAAVLYLYRELTADVLDINADEAARRGRLYRPAKKVPEYLGCSVAIRIDRMLTRWRCVPQVDSAFG